MTRYNLVLDSTRLQKISNLGVTVICKDHTVQNDVLSCIRIKRSQTNTVYKNMFCLNKMMNYKGNDIMTFR
jgi:hypothetical protein